MVLLISAAGMRVNSLIAHPFSQCKSVFLIQVDHHMRVAGVGYEEFMAIMRVGLCKDGCYESFGR